jgi:ethanolamine ammonia-lyase small subunit
LKAILQWLAASATDKDVIYFTFDKGTTFPQDLRTFVTKVHNAGVTIADVYSALLNISNNLAELKSKPIDAFKLVLQYLKLE